MIKIMHIITDLSTGGAERMLDKLLCRMDRSRFQNVVVSMTNLGTLGERIKSSGISVFTLGMRLGVPNPIGLGRLLRILRKERPHILQTWLYHADLLGLIAGKMARVSTIIWNLRCSDMDMRYYSKLSSLVINLLAKLSSFPEAVLVNSEAGQKFHRDLGYKPRRWVHIPNGFDLDCFQPDSNARATFRNELGVSDDIILIGLVARYDPMKDHETFLQAACLLLKNYAGVHFVLVGSGVDDSNKDLSASIVTLGKAKCFHLLGERKDIPHIMAALDIAAITSLTEGFSNVVGEAMASGVPCVVTDVGDLAMIVGDTGCVVPPKDPEALASAWRELIDIGTEARYKLGISARCRIEENFSLSHIISKYEIVYEEFASSGRPH